MTNEEVYDFWQAAKKINPKITLAQAAAMARRLLAAKRRRERHGPTQ
jgi:hypothetical protein